jgi:hypothetical protein
MDKQNRKEDLELEKEHCIWDEICLLLNTATISNLIYNEQYCEKMKKVFDNDFPIGRCRPQLLQLKRNIKSISEQYEREYVWFLKKAREQLEDGLEEIDESIREEIQMIFDKKICSMHFFNELYNSGKIN